MKLITSLSMIFIFCFCIGICLSNAQAVQDTPLMAKYRKYYDANNINLSTIMINFRNECKDECSNKDLQYIKNLAESHDMFGIALHGSISIDDFEKNLDIGAKMGEKWMLITNIDNKLLNNISEAAKYAQIAKVNGYVNGYSRLGAIYFRMNDSANFCSIIKEFYAKYGYMSISPYLIAPSNRAGKFFFNKCTKKTPDELIAMFGKEGQLIKGFALIKEQKYDEAYKTFESVYKASDSSMLSANAGYCLGMMNYYGKGIKRDKEKGQKLLKESFNNGIVYEKTPEQKKYALPERAELQMYPFTKGICDDIQ